MSSPVPPTRNIQNGLNCFAAAYPDRYISFGISGTNMCPVAAGIPPPASCLSSPPSPSPGFCTGRNRSAWMSPIRRSRCGWSAITGISLGFTAPRITRPRISAPCVPSPDLAVVSFADGAQQRGRRSAPAPTGTNRSISRIGRGRDPVVYENGTTFQFGKAHVHSLGEATIIACGIAVHAVF